MGQCIFTPHPYDFCFIVRPVCLSLAPIALLEQFFQDLVSSARGHNCQRLQPGADQSADNGVALTVFSFIFEMLFPR